MNWFSFHFADFSVSFLSILFEGAPFLLLGALISGTVEVFLPPQTLARLLPKNRAIAILLSGLLGGIFPMCECGAVVVIRRFLAKGLPVSCAVTYMLAAPIVSPLVALSTMAAFRAQNPWMMTSLRLGLGYLIAVTAGFVVQRLPIQAVLQEMLIRPAPEMPRTGFRIAADAVVDNPEMDQIPGAWPKLLRVISSASSDFLDVALFFVIGAGVAATFNTAVNQEVIQPLATHSAAAILTMMGLAGAMALCSSTDAFIAATFVAFPFASKLAFLVFGPVFDVKLFFLYGLVFRRKFIIGLAIGLFVAIALLCLRLSVLTQ